MLRQHEQIPYVKDLVKRLRKERSLREACGSHDKTPTEAHFTQMKKRVGAEGFRLIEAWLRREAQRQCSSQPLSSAGLVQAACVDGIDLQAWSSRDPHDTRRGLGDPDARVGRGKKGFLLGYQSLFHVDIEGFPLGHVEASLNVNEKQLVGSLLDRVLGESMEVEFLAGDSQFESQMIFSFLESRKMSHVIPWRRLKRRVNLDMVLSVKDRIDVEGPEHLRSVYHRLRAPTEGFIGRVKSRLGFRRLTWQGVDNVCIHVGLVLCVSRLAASVGLSSGRVSPTLRDDVGYDGVELEDAVHESHV